MSTYATIAGTELQGWAALLAKWEMQEAYKQELKRQAGFRDKALGEFGTRLGTAGIDTAKTEMATGEAARTAGYSRLGSVPLATGGPSGGDRARQVATAQLLGQQRAGVGKYSDWGYQQMIENLNAQRALAQISDEAGGQARVYPYRMYEAQHSWDKLAQAGQAVSALGGGSTNFGNQAPPTGGGNAFGYGGTPQAYPTPGYNPGYFPPGDYSVPAAGASQYAGGVPSYGSWVVG